MRTFKMIISPTKNKKDAAFCQYFKTNTADSKCMYNTANFYIRNTMTGLKKSPEERTPLETEVLHYVFTGIQKANEVIGQKNMKKKFAELKLAEVGGMQSAVAAFSIVSHEPFQYPTAKKWFLSYGTLDAIFKFTDNPIYRRMNSQVNQNAIRKAVAAWQGYFESLKAYKKNPAGFTGKPKIPGYKQDEEYIAWFSKQVAKLKEEDGRYYIQFVNNPDRFEIGKASLYGDLKYVKTEVKAMYGKYYILITFDDKIAEVKVPENPKRILGLDPGVNNFLGVANNFGGAPFVMNGRAVKSENQRFNKKRAKLISSVTKGSNSKTSVKYSKQLNILSQRRESFLRDYFYKCAWYICRYAKAADVDVIVMGHNDGQKQEIDLTDNVNQDFVSIPYTKFITILKTVASKCGIAVVIREESYTSQASLLDMDDIPTYKKGKRTKFLKEISQQLNELEKDECAIMKELRDAKGIISRDEFVDAFYEALPDRVKNAMKQYGYSAGSTPYNLGYDDSHIYIIRNVIVYKYNKNIPYAYEEYDGNWMMCDEAEEMEAYKKDIKKNEKLLPVSMPINSYMWTGDKFSTWYSGVYEIAIEGDMTKEYAKELAKKFAR